MYNVAPGLRRLLWVTMQLGGHRVAKELCKYRGRFVKRSSA